jgi:hypothetical protein
MPKTTEQPQRHRDTEYAQRNDDGNKPQIDADARRWLTELGASATRPCAGQFGFRETCENPGESSKARSGGGDFAGDFAKVFGGVGKRAGFGVFSAAIGRWKTRGMVRFDGWSMEEFPGISRSGAVRHEVFCGKRSKWLEESRFLDPFLFFVLPNKMQTKGRSWGDDVNTKARRTTKKNKERLAADKHSAA